MPKRRRVTYNVWVYNLATLTTRAHRQKITKTQARAQITAELHAILATNPGVVGLTETIGHQLPDVDGYRLIRNRKTPGRANIAAYVRDDLPATRIRWHDHRQTWHRTKHPGVHDPRATLTFWAGRTRVVVAHQPPKGTNNTIRAQAEGIRILARLLSTKPAGRPAMALMDANRTADETGPGPRRLARRTGGRVVGRRIDCAVVRNVRATDVEYVSHVRGVQLRSDHDHALRFTASIQTRWTRAPRSKRKETAR